MDVITERRDDGMMVPVDFTVKARRVWIFEIIEQFIGSTSDRLILSFLFHGVSWMIDWHPHARFFHNLERYNTRARGVAEHVAKLAAQSFVDIIDIVPADDVISLDGPCPLLYLPGFETGVGGVDKEDKPWEVRLVGNMSAPHIELRERNKPHGDPDGDLVVSFNDLCGPKGGVKPGYDGPAPMPEPEIKPRPRHMYAAIAFLRFYAKLLRSFVCNLDDDMRHMFFQFFVRASDLHLCVFKIVMMRDDRLWLCAIRVRTMNQGGRNSSKVACGFAEEWVESWRVQMDAVVTEWVPRQTDEFQRFYNAVVELHGLAHARPFWACVYTDNFSFSFACPELHAAGAKIWFKMNDAANIELQAEPNAGTCPDYIGVRYVLNAGFGCLKPNKRERAVTQCISALRNELTYDELESHNSFLGHVNDACDWPPGSLSGIAVVGRHRRDAIVTLTDRAADQYRSALVLLRDRPMASFWTGVKDATFTWSGCGVAMKEIRFHETDACTDPQPYPGNDNPQPYICGAVGGTVWRYKLSDEWQQRHITLTESCGPAIATVLAAPLFPQAINVLGGDASSGTATTLRRARSANLTEVSLAVEAESVYKDVVDSLWVLPIKGWGNGFSDAGSRDNMPVMHALAAAYGIKLHVIDANAHPVVSRMMDRILQRTRPLGGPPRALSPAASAPMARRAHPGGRIATSNKRVRFAALAARKAKRGVDLTATQRAVADALVREQQGVASQRDAAVLSTMVTPRRVAASRKRPASPATGIARGGAALVGGLAVVESAALVDDVIGSGGMATFLGGLTLASGWWVLVAMILVIAVVLYGTDPLQRFPRAVIAVPKVAPLQCVLYWRVSHQLDALQEQLHRLQSLAGSHSRRVRRLARSWAASADELDGEVLQPMLPGVLEAYHRECERIVPTVPPRGEWAPSPPPSPARYVAEPDSMHSQPPVMAADQYHIAWIVIVDDVPDRPDLAHRAGHTVPGGSDEFVAVRFQTSNNDDDDVVNFEDVLVLPGCIKVQLTTTLTDVVTCGGIMQTLRFGVAPPSMWPAEWERESVTRLCVLCCTHAESDDDTRTAAAAAMTARLDALGENDWYYHTFHLTSSVAAQWYRSRYNLHNMADHDMPWYNSDVIPFGGEAISSLETLQLLHPPAAASSADYAGGGGSASFDDAMGDAFAPGPPSAAERQAIVARHAPRYVPHASDPSQARSAEPGDSTVVHIGMFDLEYRDLISSTHQFGRARDDLAVLANLVYELTHAPVDYARLVAGSEVVNYVYRDGRQLLVWALGGGTSGRRNVIRRWLPHAPPANEPLTIGVELRDHVEVSPQGALMFVTSPEMLSSYLPRAAYWLIHGGDIPTVAPLAAYTINLQAPPDNAELPPAVPPHADPPPSPPNGPPGDDAPVCALRDVCVPAAMAAHVTCSPPAANCDAHRVAAYVSPQRPAARSSAVSPTMTRCSHDRHVRMCALSDVAATQVAHASPAPAVSARTLQLVDSEPTRVAPRVRPGSPQPTTAQAARKASTTSVADILVADTSEYSLCPDDPERLRRMVTDVGDARDEGIPQGSSNADSWGFGKVVDFAKSMGPNVRWMRPREAVTAAAQLVETWFTSLALFHIAVNLGASARRAARGFTQGQPQSALNAIYGWRRVMRDCGRYLADMVNVLRVLKGLNMRYRRLWGPEAFVRAKQRVFSRAMLLRLASACVGLLVGAWTLVRRAVWACLIPFLSSTGTRCNEFTCTFPADTYLTRSHFCFVDDEFNDLVMTPDVISSRTRGSYLRGMSAESKCDRLNVEWGAHKQWFMLDDSDPLNFAAAWQRWELEYPCPVHERQHWPAFSPSGDARPFTPSTARADHADLCERALGADDARDRTIHAHRATLATALVAARNNGNTAITDGVIQMLERWKTADSVRNYDHVRPADYAGFVAAGLASDAAAASSADVPEIEPADNMMDVESVADALEAANKRSPDAAASASSSRSKRAAPLGAREAGDATAPIVEFDIGGTMVRALPRDAADLVGRRVDVPNVLWGIEDGDATACTVAAFIGKHTYDDGRSRPSYVITEAESGDHYPITASYLARIAKTARVTRKAARSA